MIQYYYCLDRGERTVRFPIPRASKRLKGVYLEIRLVLLARVSNNVFIMLLLPEEIGRVKFRA